MEEDRFINIMLATGIDLENIDSQLAESIFMFGQVIEELALRDIKERYILLEKFVFDGSQK